MKAKIEHQICGIYCITNIINNKVYIGKSKNIYRRIHQHLYDMKNKRVKNENSHFLNAWYKYGNENFKYHILEKLKLDDNISKEREMYWILKYKSNNRKFGYNLRLDSSTNMIVHKETSEKISKRLKKEWKNGIRKDHGKKLSENWSKTPERNKIQSKIMTKALTKYSYNIYDIDMNFIENCKYKRLKELKLTGALFTFHRMKKKGNINNICKCKNHFVEKIKILKI